MGVGLVNLKGKECSWGLLKMHRWMCCYIRSESVVIWHKTVSISTNLISNCLKRYRYIAKIILKGMGIAFCR